MNSLSSILASLRVGLVAAVAFLALPVWANGGGGGGASPFFQLEPLVVNLAPPDTKKFLQVTVVIETKDPAATQVLKDYGPIIRSRTILILTTKSYQDLKSVEGKQRLMDELLDMARITLPDVPKDPSKGVSDVHLTSFVIQ